MSRVLRPLWGHGIRCLRQPLLWQLFEIWLIFRSHHAFSFGRHLFDVWTQFNRGYGWLGLHIWWWMIRCCLIFWSTIHLMSYWGICPFQLRFINLHGVTWSSSLTRCMSSRWSIVILSWSPSGVSLRPFSQAHTFRHLDIIMLLLLGDASLIFGFDVIVGMDDWDYTFDDEWFDVVRFLIYHTSSVILGHISSSVEIFRSSLICMIIPIYEIHTELIICFYFVMIPK